LLELTGASSIFGGFAVFVWWSWPLMVICFAALVLPWPVAHYQHRRSDAERAGGSSCTFVRSFARRGATRGSCG
jgi:hypothetical protein